MDMAPQMDIFTSLRRLTTQGYLFETYKWVRGWLGADKSIVGKNLFQKVSSKRHSEEFLFGVETKGTVAENT